MPHTAPDRRTLRRTAGVIGAGAIGAVAVISLGAAPALAADPAPGLVLGKIAPPEGLKPGGSFDVPVTFTNTGPADLGKVWIAYSVTEGLSQAELPSNCLRYEVSSFDEAPSRSDAVCEFDQTVKPGVAYAPETPVTIKALDRALYDDLSVSVANYDAAPSEGASTPVRGIGPAVKLVERPDAPAAEPGSAEHEDWDRISVRVTADSTADFQVTGAALKGKVGETVDLRAKFTNAGPGWVLPELGAPSTRILIKMPAGTEVTKTDGFCNKVDTGTYECGTAQAWVEAAYEGTYDFKLKITKAVAGAKGSVALNGTARPFDENKKNDKAAITLAVAGSGSTGGAGGSTGGSGSTGGDGSTSTGGSGSSSTGGSGSTGGTGGSSTTGTSGDSAVDGDLASTGSGPALPLAGAAAAALAVGTGTVVVMRRRAARR
ncbi:hypothetical protein AB9Q10_32710 [Streptomyces krungchingensis]|uniref:hypothetical protein n=1 Tax=Streptomyces krungchingensis TaxID=1565034 RepID=UPI003CF5FBF6